MLAPPLKLLGGPGPPSSYAYVFLLSKVFSALGGKFQILVFFRIVLIARISWTKKKKQKKNVLAIPNRKPGWEALVTND